MKKSIKYDRQGNDFRAEVDGVLIGYYATTTEAERACDEFVYEALTHGDTATATELNGGSYCITCGNDGDCPDCEPATDPYAPLGACAICGAAAWCTSVAGLLCPDHESVLEGYYTVCELMSAQVAA